MKSDTLSKKSFGPGVILKMFMRQFREF